MGVPFLGSVRVGLCAAFAGALMPSPAAACCPGRPPTTAAFPRPGTTNVSTATSVIVFSAAEPSGLKLLANGEDLPLLLPISLGSGVDASGAHGGYWQTRVAAAGSLLLPSAEHVLSQTTASGALVELTRFSTGPGYDKAGGASPVVRSLRLWRVRYPTRDIGSGNCVFAEYHGFIAVDYDPATVPNTAPASIVSTFQLAPKYAGSAQTFVYMGDTPFIGLEPIGDYPLPTGQWQPELDPTRSYCLAIRAFGDGDLARQALASQEICAEVVQLSAAGAPPPPQIGAGGTGGGGTGGNGGGDMAGCATSCVVAGSPESTSLTWLLLVVVVLRRRFGRIGALERMRAVRAHRES